MSEIHLTTNTAVTIDSKGQPRCGYCGGVAEHIDSRPHESHFEGGYEVYDTKITTISPCEHSRIEPTS